MSALAPIRAVVFTVTISVFLFTVVPKSIAHAAPAVPTGDFSIEVSPSALSTTVKPGVKTTLELKIRNASTKSEQLKIQARNFTFDAGSQNIIIGDRTSPDLAAWVSYSNPTFTIPAGETFTQRITVNLPAEAGFSYPFSLVVSRVNEQPTKQTSGRQLRGSVAVFALVNIDKPGATRRLQIEGLKTSQKVYEYLPTDISLSLRNVGNSIVQPYGNIYIQRGTDQTKDPISTLPANASAGYILPGTTRALTTSWDKGFPVYKTDDAGKKRLVWNWSAVSQLRIGKYTAKVVAVYNDGQRDVPVIAETSFWVIPWRLLLGAFVIALLIGFGLWVVIRQLLAIFSRAGRRRPTS